MLEELQAQFDIIREIGRGGSGVVYEAREKTTGRTVALKTLYTAGPQDGDLLNRFRRETDVLSQLRHRHLVALYSSGEIHGLCYLVMEYIEGPSLEELMKKRLKDESFLIHVLTQALSGLAQAHSQGVIHRDLKPGNIMVERETERTVVMDFGLAKPEGAGQTVTSPDVVLGTPAYMSPERVCGLSGKPDRRSDLYAVGIILYEIVAGQVPFDGPTPLAIAKRILKDPPRPPSRVRSSVSADIERVILKSIEKDRDRRYQTAEEFMEDLNAYLSGQPVRATEVPIPPIPQETPQETRQKRSGWFRWLKG